MLLPIMVSWQYSQKQPTFAWEPWRK